MTSFLLNYNPTTLSLNDIAMQSSTAKDSQAQSLEYPSEKELTEAYRNIPVSSYVGTIENPKGVFNPVIPEILPHEQVFSIQVGDRLFKLSGASFSSDAPNYFTTFFLKYKDLPAQEWPTLYIDRSPEVFDMIVSHLQGYYVTPTTDFDYVYLLLDANYYHLPRLIRQLANSEIHIRIGGEPFRISRSLFNGPGNSPNFFTLGFSSFFGSEIAPPSKIFKRPPSIAPPTVPQRSGELFRDLLKVFHGSVLDIKDENHRSLLLSECRYYRFLGLEQQLIAHSIHNNRIRNAEEIIIELTYIRPKQLKFKKLCDTLVPASAQLYLSPEDLNNNTSMQLGNIITSYKRPFIDEYDREVIIQLTSSESTYFEPVSLYYTPESFSQTGKRQWEATFYDSAATKMKAIIDTLINGANRKLQKQLKTSQGSFSNDEIPIKIEEPTVSSSVLEEFGLPENMYVRSGSADTAGTPTSTRSNSTSRRLSENPIASTITVATGPRNGYLACVDDAYILLNGKVLDPDQFCNPAPKHNGGSSDENNSIQGHETDSILGKRNFDSTTGPNTNEACDAQESVTKPAQKTPIGLHPIRMILTKSQWRIFYTKNHFMLELLKAEGYSGQQYLNSTRTFI